MAADSSKRMASKIAGLVVRPHPVSDKSYVESVVGFIHDVVPQAYAGSSRLEDKEIIVWLRFETSDINDTSLLTDDNGNTLPLLLIVGYTNGVQIWCVGANGEAQEILSWRQGPVRVLRVIPSPDSDLKSLDRFAKKRPVVAVCDSISVGQQFCNVSFISLKTGDQVECIKFSSPVKDIYCNKRAIAVVCHKRISVFSNCTFKEMFYISGVYPDVGRNLNSIALGSKWLAFADKKLVTMHQTCGGMVSEGLQSYTSTVIHAAKTITKGLTSFGETVANTLTGHKGQDTGTTKKDIDCPQPGVITVIDVQTIGNGEINLSDDIEGDGIIAHFTAHANEPVASVVFDPSGMLLFTASKLGHDFHIFRLFSHPASSTLGAVHHLYTLHRGDTTAKVQDVAFSLDSRWIAVSTLRGTTHIFPITPYGGPVSARTHTSPRVVNRLSRFQKSAGLEEMQHLQTTVTGRNSPVLSGSPVSSATAANRTSYDAHPSLTYNSSAMRMGNPRLPPYAHPVAVLPLVQVKQPGTFQMPIIINPAGSRSPPKKGKENSMVKQCGESCSVAVTFAPPRAWLAGSPSLARDIKEKQAVDSLYVIGCSGNLVEYTLEPHAVGGHSKGSDELPIELEAISHAQWNLLRPLGSQELKPPLPSTNPLMAAHDAVSNHRQEKFWKCDMETPLRQIPSSSPSQSEEMRDESEDSWLSQIEIITHAGPHRRLWMGPQFSFKTFQQPSNTTILSASSSALLSQSTGNLALTDAEIYNEQLVLQGIRPARSSPVTMPGHHPLTASMTAPLLIEASSGSFEQSPPSFLEVCGSWPDSIGSSAAVEKGQIEDQLKKTLAEAMLESPPKDTTRILSEHSCMTEFGAGQ